MKETEVKAVENKQDNEVMNEKEVRSNNATVTDICVTITAIGLVTSAAIIVFGWARNKVKARKMRKAAEAEVEMTECEEAEVTDTEK